MAVYQNTLGIHTKGLGHYEITRDVERELNRSKLSTGIVSVFCRHTSCSLVMMENADPSAWRDLQAWLERLVPENDPGFRHTLEGADDMPAHIKMTLSRTSEMIPFSEGRLLLGAWQGIFLWEHRRSAHERNLIFTAMGE